MYTVPSLFMGVIMSKMVKLYDELIKISKLIDSKWDAIMERTDTEFPCGKYVIVKEFGAWDEHHEYWRVAVEYSQTYSLQRPVVLAVFKRGDGPVESDLFSLSSYENLLITSLSDDVLIVSTDDDGDKTEERIRIPYDRSCSTEERLFAIDVSYDSPGIRELLYRLVEFQNMKLDNVDVLAYSFNYFSEVYSGEVYDTLASRPFFKVQK